MEAWGRLRGVGRCRGRAGVVSRLRVDVAVA